MSKDLLTVLPREIIPVTRFDVSDVDEDGNQFVDVQGFDLTSTAEVRINHQRASYTVLRPTRLRALVPETEVGNPITAVFVLSSDLTLDTNGSLLQFQLPPISVEATGLMRLIQRFVKCLLQAPGSDMYNRDRGGGLRTLTGRTFTSGNGSKSLITDATIAVDRTAEQLLQEQARMRGTPPSERLLLANILDAEESTADQSLLIQIEVVSQLGRRGQTGLFL
jgi:hypothetical protein